MRLSPTIGYTYKDLFVYKNSYITDERHISRIDSHPVESRHVPAPGLRGAPFFCLFLAWPIVSGELISGWEFVHWQ